MKHGSITPGDVVIVNKRRGRVVAARGGDLRVLQGAATVTCAAGEAHRIDSWWNTPEMRAAFTAGKRTRRRAHLKRGARHCAPQRSEGWAA